MHAVLPRHRDQRCRIVGPIFRHKPDQVPFGDLPGDVVLPTPEPPQIRPTVFLICGEVAHAALGSLQLPGR